MLPDSFRRHAWILLVAWVGAALPAVAQVFRAQSDLVVLQVAVHDRRAAPVADLTQQEFRVWEDGVLQDVRFFGSWDQPVAIGLVVDNSGSMTNRRQEVIEAARAFARASNPQDALFTVNFNERVSFGLPEDTPFTSDMPTLDTALATIQAAGQTALYDGIAVGLDRVAESPLEQRVLIVISDGDDNRSRRTFREVLDRATRTNTTIYAVGIFDAIEGGNKKVLRDLAKTSGGLAFFPSTLPEIRQVLDRICLDVRHRYTIGYVPTNSRRDGTFRTVKITAVDRAHARGLEVRARTGYVAGADGPR